MAQVTVRRARPEDVPGLLVLWQEMMGFHARLDPRFVPATDGATHFGTALKEWMADARWQVLVAEAEGKLVGYTIGMLHDDAPVFALRSYGFVSDICVAPEWRRTGVGRKLFSELRAWFHRHGQTSVQLNVSAVNPTSQGFWRAMGFQDYLDRLWLDL
jgi:ribosomal protein S18 acetylase RimI-like enzyme